MLRYLCIYIDLYIYTHVYAPDQLYLCMKNAEGALLCVRVTWRDIYSKSVPVYNK